MDCIALSDSDVDMCVRSFGNFTPYIGERWPMFCQQPECRRLVACIKNDSEKPVIFYASAKNKLLQVVSLTHTAYDIYL